MSAVAKRAALVALIIGAALAGALLAPTAHVAHGALIVNSAVTSTIVDAHGYAVSLTPAGLSCGIDSTVWCEVADWSN